MNPKSLISLVVLLLFCGLSHAQSYFAKDYPAYPDLIPTNIRVHPAGGYTMSLGTLQGSSKILRLDAAGNVTHSYLPSPYLAGNYSFEIGANGRHWLCWTRYNSNNSPQYPTYDDSIRVENLYSNLSPSWRSNFDVGCPSNEKVYPTAIKETADGLLITGTITRSNSPASSPTMFVAKVSDSGQMLWHKAYGRFRGFEVFPQNITELQNGEVLVNGMGKTNFVNDNPTFVWHFNATGDSIGGALYANFSGLPGNLIEESNGAISYLASFNWFDGPTYRWTSYLVYDPQTASISSAQSPYIPDGRAVAHQQAFANGNWWTLSDTETGVYLRSRSGQSYLVSHPGYPADLHKTAKTLTYTSVSMVHKNFDAAPNGDIVVACSAKQPGGTRLPVLILTNTSGATSLEEEQMEQMAFSVYPNPSQGPFHLQMEAQEDTYLKGRLADAQGRLLREFVPEEGMEIDLEGQPAGIYFLILTTNTGKQNTAKLLYQP